MENGIIAHVAYGNAIKSGELLSVPGELLSVPNKEVCLLNLSIRFILGILIVWPTTTIVVVIIIVAIFLGGALDLLVEAINRCESRLMAAKKRICPTVTFE